KLSTAFVAEYGDQVVLLLEIDEQPHRLAVATPAWQLGAIKRVEAAVGREHQALRSGLGREREFQGIVALEGDAGKVCHSAAQRANPAFLGHHDRDRLALDQRLLDDREVVLGSLRKAATAPTERGVGPERVTHLPDLAGDRLPLLRLRADQLVER